jgi:hypothetical protein
MLKLLLCIVGIFVFSVSLLQLRQQRLSDRFEMNRLHDRIEAAQSRLWGQQLKIATVTTPEALTRRVQRAGGVGAMGGSGGEVDGAGGVVGGRPWLDSRVSPARE